MLGVMRVEEPFEPYFCTPKGARVFGRSGVDGIHFCFVRGFGETVFAVSPMNGREDCVHPVAKSFRDFLRLLLALHDAAAIEQAWQWDAAQLEDFEQKHPSNEEQMAALDRIVSTFYLRQMAEELTVGTENEVWFQLSREIEDYMKHTKGLIPNVDFYSATVYHVLGIDSSIFTLIFAMSRVSGWIAHIQEQQKNNKLIRPRSNYLGQFGLEYLPIGKR